MNKVVIVSFISSNYSFEDNITNLFDIPLEYAPENNIEVLVSGTSKSTAAVGVINVYTSGRISYYSNGVSNAIRFQSCWNTK